MNSGQALFWVVFSIFVGILYYRFAIVENPVTVQVKENFQKTWATIRKWLPAGELISGVMLAGLGQYNLSTTTLAYAHEPSIAATQQGIDIFGTGFPPAIDIFANYLLLLAGCALVACALRSYQAIPDTRPQAQIPQGSFQLSLNYLSVAGAAGLVVNFILLWQLHDQSQLPYLVVVWLATIVGFGYLAARFDANNGISNAPHLRRQDVLWLAILFGLGLVIGMYRLQSLPNQLMGDEGSFWNLASAIASGGSQPWPFDYGVYTFPVLSSVAQGIILKIFGISLWAWRFSSLLAGLLAVIPLYLLARELFDRRVAVVSCVVMVTCEYFLAFSRLGYNNSQSLFPVTLTVYFLVIGLRRRSMLLIYLAGCAAGLGFYTYPASRSALVIVGLVVITLWLQERRQFGNVFKVGAILALGWAIFASPLLAYGSAHNPDLMTQKLRENVFFNTDSAGLARAEIVNDPNTVLSSDGVFFFNPGIYGALIERGIARTLLAFNMPSLVTSHFITAPLAGSSGAAVFTLGMLISLLGLKERRYQLLLYWFAVNIFLLSALNTEPPHYQHMVSMIPLIALWAGLGIVSLANGITRLCLDRPGFKTFLILAMTTGVALSGLYSYFVIMPSVYRPNQEQIIAWTALYAENEKIIFVSDAPQGGRAKPFMVNAVRTDISYMAVAPDELAKQLDGRSVVFYVPGIAKQVKPILKSAWSEIAFQRTFYSQDGSPILKSAANFAVNYGPPAGTGAALRDSYLRPGLWLVLAVVVFLVLTACFRETWLERASNWAKRTYHRITAEAEME